MQNIKIKRLLRSVALLLSLIMAVTMLSACGGTASTGVYKRVNDSLLESGVLTENADYKLLWDKDGKTVIFRSNTTDDYWSDILYDNFIGGSTSANSNSPIYITVYNTQTLKTITLRSYTEMAESGSVICKKIENGIRVGYFFDKYKIAVPVDYVLRDNSIEVSIDSSKITEGGDTYKLVSVSLVPFMCSVLDNAEDANLFVPVGSGALMSVKETVDGVRKYSGEVYGADAARQIPESYVDDEAICMPVFGAYGGGKALMGIIENGAGAAFIEAQAGNDALGYSNIYATFYVRGYDLFKSNSYAIEEDITTRFSDKMPGEKLSVGYYPLYGEDANYNGMAKLYRNYLSENGGLSKSEIEQSPYSVTLLGGTTVTKSFFGLPYKKLVALTDFKSAKDIVADVKSSTGIAPVVRLFGYGDMGMRAGSIAGGKSYKSVYGSKNDIKALEDFCKDENINLFTDYETVCFSKSGSGFSLNSDTAKTAILKRIVHYPISPTRIQDSKNTYSVISRSKLGDAVNAAVKKADKYSASAVCLSSLGGTAFSDYSSLNYYNKGQIEKDVSGILKGIKEKGYNLAVASANSYAACASDVIFDTVTDNGNYNVLDSVVPFYQLVFHSYKQMYTQAANLSENIEKTVARAAAFGMGLGFTVSEDYVDESNDLDEYGLYSVLYSDNRDVIVKFVSENGFADLYGKTCESVLEEYTVENGVSKSVFSNGTTVYVNQTSDNVSCPAGKLAPFGFVVV